MVKIKRFINVTPEALPDIMVVLFARSESDFTTAIMALGEALYHTHYSINIVNEILQTIPNAITRYLEIIPALAKEVEKQQRHNQKPINGDQFKYLAIISGNAEPSDASFLVAHPAHVYYDNDGYWSCLYELLLMIEPKVFLRTLEEVNSPLMLSLLISYIALNEFDANIHKLLLETKWDWMCDLAAEWVWGSYMRQDLDMDALLNSMVSDAQLKQSCYILSEAIFYARMLPSDIAETKRNKAWTLCEKLIERITNLCNSSVLTSEEQNVSLMKVKDCEQTCNAWLILSMSRLLLNNEVRNLQLERIINAFFYRDRVFSFDKNKNCRYVEFVVEAAILRYKEEIEEYIGSKFLDWSSLDMWLEPYMRDRNYSRWSNAQKAVEWNIQFLHIYNESGHELAGKLKIYYNRAMSDTTLLTDDYSKMILQ